MCYFNNGNIARNKTDQKRSLSSRSVSSSEYKAKIKQYYKEAVKMNN